MDRSREIPWNLRRNPLYCTALFAVLGIVWGRHGEPAPGGLLCAAIALMIAWYVLRWRRTVWATYLVLSTVTVVFACWTSMRWNFYRADDLGLRASDQGTPVVVEAILLGVPRTVQVRDPWAPGFEQFSQCRIAVRRLRDGQCWKPASGDGRLVIGGQLRRQWKAGDHVRIFGVLSRFPPPANPGEVARRTYFRHQRQLFQLRVPNEDSLQCIHPAPWWSLRRHVESLRQAACDQLCRYVAPQWFPLAAALILGARHHLDWQTLEPFLQTGTVHLLAISGLHLGMLVYGLFALLRFGLVARKPLLWTAVGLVVFYAILTSGQPPVIRATVLTVGICVARLLGRHYSTWNLWGAGAMVILLYNPLQLFDVGVQLSFLAVAALIATSKPPWQKAADEPLTRWLEEARPSWQRTAWWLIRTIGVLMWVGLMVWLVTLPLVVYNFHRASPIAVLVNPLVWIPIASGLLSGFAVLFFGPWCPPLAQLFGWVCDMSLKLAHATIVWADQLTGAHMWLPSPSGCWIGLIYGTWFLWLNSGPRWRLWTGCGCWAIGLAAWLLSWLGPCLFPPSTSQLRCTFFAVGHGTCVLIELPCGNALLYDAGRFGSPRPLVQYLSETIWSRRIARIDLAIVSHADSDHFNALPGLVERVAVRDVALPRPLSESSSLLSHQLARFLEEKSLPTRLLAAGEVIRFPDGVTLDVLHPPAGFRPETDNSGSIVVRIRYAGRTILLPGDLEGSGQQRLISGRPIAIDVLMSPHHASVHSNRPNWSQWARARHVVICDAGPLPEETVAAYRLAGTRVWYTQECGAIEVTIDRDGTLRLAGYKRGLLWCDSSIATAVY